MQGELFGETKRFEAPEPQLGLFDEVLHIRGRLKVEIHDARRGDPGPVIATYEIDNLIVTTGLNLVRDLMAGDSVNALTHFAVGTGTTAPVVGNTTLETEVLRDVITQFVDTSGQLDVKYFLSSLQANGNTLGEAGIFNAASSGTMFNRALLSPTIVKTSALAVTFTWSITIA